MKFLRKHLLYIWSLFILILTLFPTPEYNGEVETYYDKVAHVIMFGVFAYLLFTSLKIKNNFVKFLISVSSGLAFSLLIEFLQLYVPGRDASHWDFVAGALGVLVATGYASLHTHN